MSFYPSFHHHKKFDFGFLPARLAYKRGKSEVLEAQRQEDVLKEIDRLREGDNKFDQLKTAVDAYNALVRTKLHIRFEKHLLKMETDNEGDILIPQTIANIEDILELKDQKLTEDERKTLLKIKAELGEVGAERLSKDGALENTPRVNPESASVAGELLMHMVERTVEGKERKDQWLDRKMYQEIEGVYETASQSTLIYEPLFQNKQGDFDPQKAKENKNLFLALMENKTDGFKKDFSDMFDSSHEKNMADYPYLYKTWVEIQNKDLITRIKVQEERVRDYEPQTDLETILDLSGKNAGVHFSAIEAIPSKPDAAYWKERARLINEDVIMLRTKAKESPIDPRVDAGRLKDDAVSLQAHATYAEEEYRLANLRADEAKIAQNFTKESLRSPSNRNNLIEAMMLWYQKSMETVDKRELLNPAVAHLLIANVFEKGFETSKTHNSWMLDTVNSSKYFDMSVTGRELDSTRRAALELAYLGGRVADQLENSNNEIGLIEGLIALQGLSDAEAENTMASLAAEYTPELIQKYTQFPPDELPNKRDEISAANVKREAFLQMAHAIIQNPYADDQGNPSEALVELDQNGDGHLDADLSTVALLSAGDLSNAQAALGKIEMNYNLLTLAGRIGEKDDAQMLDRMGINVTRIYAEYVAQLDKTPEMHVRNWPEHLISGGNPGALADFLEKIIPPGTTPESQKGKEALLTVLRSMDNSETADPKTKAERNTAKDVIFRIADHIINTERVEGNADRVMPEVQERLKGLGLSEKVQSTLGMVWGMVSGDGPWLTADRLAGVIGIIGLYKLLKTKAGKATGLLFAINQIYKKKTGKELPELLGLNTIGEAAEGTHEEAIAQHGQERMNGFENPDDNFDKDTHLKALMALGPVPADKLFAWYEASDPNGGDYNTEKEIKLFNALGIKRGALGLKGADKGIRERFIYREVFSHFYEMVAEKDGQQSTENTRKALKERWVTTIHDPNYKPHYTTFVFAELMERAKGKPESITFKMMLEAETNAYMVEAAMNQNGVAPVLETVTTWVDELEDWARRGIINPGEGYAEEFFQAAGETANEGADLLGDMADSLGLKLHFAKESVKFWYQNNEWEIRRMGEGMWGIFKSSATLPIHVVYGGLETVVPWVDTKLRQVNELVRSDVLATPVDPEKGFTVSDIAGARAWEIGTDGQFIIDALDNRPIINRNEDQNPQFANYGLFQHAFYEAYNNGPLNTEAIKTGEGAKYYNEVDGVGYHIVEVNHQTAGIDINNPMFTSPENRYGQMQTVAREEAVKFYISQNIPQDYIEKYMYSIHSVLQTKPQEAVVVSFRLPRPDSVEGSLLASGHWVDSKNPNDWKKRAPVIFEPGRPWENFKAATGLKYDKGRQAYAFAGKYGVQALYLWRASMETLGYASEAIVKLFYTDKYEHEADWIGEVFKTKEETNQYLDEASTAASNPALASSAFFKDINNANMYKLAHEFAIKYDQDVYLGFFRDAYATDPKGKPILDDKNQPIVYHGIERIGDRPADYRKANFMNYYENVWLGEQRHEAIPRFAEYMATIPDDNAPIPTPTSPEITP